MASSGALGGETGVRRGVGIASYCPTSSKLQTTHCDIAASPRPGVGINPTSAPSSTPAHNTCHKPLARKALRLSLNSKDSALVAER
jgi:hypothetical protein